MSLLDSVINYIQNKLTDSPKQEPNPMLWENFQSWLPSGITYVPREIVIPKTIPQEQVFDTLKYIKINHPNIATKITHIHFDENITNIPENMFQGWNLECVDLKNSPNLVIGKGAFANTPNLRYMILFDKTQERNNKVQAKLEIGENAFANSAIQNLIIKAPCRFNMPIINELKHKDEFTFFLGDPNIEINGKEEEVYHVTNFRLMNKACISSNPLFVLLKKYHYSYDFGDVSENISSYFVDERNIRNLLMEAFNKEEKTLVLDNALADEIEDKMVISAYRHFDGDKPNYNNVRENFNNIVFDIIRNNNFCYGHLNKLVFSIDNIELPMYCLKGNETIKTVEIAGTGISLDRFALSNSSVENLTGNYVEIGHRALYGSNITELTIPWTCRVVGSDIIDHRCKVVFENNNDTVLDSYFINPDFLAEKKPKKIDRRKVKQPTLYLTCPNRFGGVYNSSVEKYKRIHKVELKDPKEHVLTGVSKFKCKGGRDLF